MNDAARGSGSSDAAALADPALRAFGFTVDDDRWFAQLAPRLGSAALGRIGPFVLIEQAGRGGQGLVYRARQERPSREVALKRLAAGVFATPEMRARFEREIESAAALDHPNIVAVYGVHEVDAQTVVALQWIDGRPLDQWARPPGAEPRSVSAILGVFERICDALAHAHQRGVIHRDLKPSNILVDAQDEPHVLDFGLARRSIAGDSPSLTQSGAFLGTPAYAAPEQLRGDLRRVDVRTDVYALGAVLFHALSGEPPVDGRQPPAELAARLESGPPALERVAPRIDRALASIVTKALQPDPRHRYPSVEALLADLQRFQGGQTVLAHPPTNWYRTRMFMRRYRWPLAIGGAFLVLTSSATLISTTQYWRAARALEAELAARADSDRDRNVLIAVNEFVRQMIEAAGESGRARGPELTVREMLDRAAERLDNPPSTLGPAAEASLRLVVANSYRRLGLDAQSIRHLERALELRRTLFGPVSLPVAETTDALGRAYRALGRLAEAEQAVQSAWDLYGQLVPPDDGYLAVVANSIGLVKRSLRKYEEAEQWYLEALRRYREAFGPDTPHAGTVLLNLGVGYIQSNRLVDARRSFEECLALHQRLAPGELNVDAVTAEVNLAHVLSRLDDPDGDAEQRFATALRHVRAVLGDRHPRIGGAIRRYAEYLERQERFEQAAVLLRDAYEVALNNNQSDEAFQVGAQLSRVLARDDRRAEAAETAADVLACCPAAADAGGDMAAARVTLAEVLLESPWPAFAIEQLRLGEAALRTSGGPLAEQQRARELLQVHGVSPSAGE